MKKTIIGVLFFILMPLGNGFSQEFASEGILNSNLTGADSLSEVDIYKPSYGILQYRDNEVDKFGFIKFQININKPIIHGTPFKIPIELGGAYTFRALWEVMADSAPFEDYFHNPELFLTLYKENLLNLRIGIEHESNGKAKADSRSWNKIYVQPRLLIELPDNQLGFHTVGIYLKSWYKLNENRRNKDITDFAGYGEVQLKLYGNNHNFFLTHSRGRKLELGTTILEYMYKLKNGWALYIQYFDGYGEMLVDYDKHSSSLGAGFSLLYF